MPNAVIESFTGVNIRDESTDLSSEGSVPLRRAENVYLKPNGSVSRPLIYERLWGLTNLKNYAATLGVTSTDQGCAILIRNEGYMILAFYDFTYNQSLGSLYVGEDPENPPSGPPTFIVPNPTMQVVWKGLANQRKWNGLHSGNISLMGNGCDINLAFDNSTLTIRPQNDQVRPLEPTVSFQDADDSVAQDASLAVNGVLFQALEPDFRPETDFNPNYTGNIPYYRARGNYVQVAVVQTSVAYFSSDITGYGSASTPFVYTVYCPMTLPTEQELVNFINRDANADGIIKATLIGSGTAQVRLFPAFALSGGVTQFSPTDVFAGPYAAVALTYFKKGSLPGQGSETMASPVVTTQNGSGRISVTITPDTLSTTAQGYDAIRIYVADVGSQTFGLSVEEYGSFLRVLEVPNTPGTYTIAPSMLNATYPLPTEQRYVPPCNMFKFAQNKIIMSGNPNYPMRYWYTATATKENPFPEGLGIYDYADIRPQVMNDAIVALGSYRDQAVIYTKTNAYPFDVGTTARFAIRIGAVNTGCVMTWTNGAQYYVGRDLIIYTLTQPVTDAKSEVPDFNLPFPQIGNYIQQYCDASDTSYPTSIVDSLNKNWWIFLRGTIGNMQSFCVNLEQNQITGPFDFPQLMDTMTIVPGDTRFVGMDMAGNLFWMDFNQPITISETFDNTDSITLYPASTAADVNDDGYGIIQVADSPAMFVKRAQLMRLQTGWMNLNGEPNKKSIYSVTWQTLEGSSGLVSVTAFNDRGAEVTRYYGELMAHKTRFHKVNLAVSGSVVQILITIVCADDLPCVIRNIGFEWQGFGLY